MESNSFIKKSKFNQDRLLIIIFAVVVISGALVWFGYNVVNKRIQKAMESVERNEQASTERGERLENQTENLKGKTATPDLGSAISSASPMTDETANWKTYKNEILKISFRYASSWSIIREDSKESLGGIVFDAGNSKTFTLYRVEGDGGRGFEGAAKFIRYDDTKISGNKIILGKKVEYSSSYAEDIGSTSGFAITTTTINGPDNKNYSW